MKAKITKKADLGLVKTAVLTGTFNGKTIEVGVTSTNTTWRTVFGNTPAKDIKVGQEIELDDSLISEAENVDPATRQSTGKKNGRYYIARVGVDKFEQAARMAVAEQKLLEAGF